MQEIPEPAAEPGKICGVQGGRTELGEVARRRFVSRTGDTYSRATEASSIMTCIGNAPMSSDVKPVPWAGMPT